MDHLQLQSAFKFVAISRFGDGGQLMTAANLCLEAVQVRIRMRMRVRTRLRTGVFPALCAFRNINKRLEHAHSKPRTGLYMLLFTTISCFIYCTISPRCLPQNRVESFKV